MLRMQTTALQKPCTPQLIMDQGRLRVRGLTPAESLSAIAECAESKQTDYEALFRG